MTGPTIGPSEHNRQLYLNRKARNINLEIWDVSGQDKFRSTTKLYLRDADACILVYDITERASLENIKKVWLPDIREKGHEDVTIALLGNKADIGDNLA